MLHHFTWHQFLTAAMILTIAWYTGIMLFFRKELTELFSEKPKEVEEPLRHAWAEDFSMEDSPAEDDLMGKAAEPEGLSVLGMNDFSFTGRSAGPADRPGTEALQGLIPDVLEEIKTALHALEVNGGDKADFMSLFKLAAAKYPKEKIGRHLPGVNAWIAEHVPFALSEAELAALWE